MRARRRRAMRHGEALMISACALLIALGSAPALAQTFNSGSTGADGAFNPDCNPKPCIVTAPLPESGVFNFTTVNIPVGVTVRFTRNAANTPVTILATGNVTIAGIIDVSGSPGRPGGGGIQLGSNGGAGGPGGFDGGSGANGVASLAGGAGLGPGGGAGGPVGNNNGGGGGFATAGGTLGATDGAGGQPYGTAALLPLIGGSGGGGGAVAAGQAGQATGSGGGGGGGALLIASSGTIALMTGQLLALG